MVRVELDRLAVAGDRLAALAAQLERHAEVVADERGLGSQLGRLLEGDDRLEVTLLSHEDQPEQVLRVAVVRVGGEAGDQFDLGLIEAVQIEQRARGEELRGRVVGDHLQSGARGLERLLEIAAVVLDPREVDEALDRARIDRDRGLHRRGGLVVLTVLPQRKPQHVLRPGTLRTSVDLGLPVADGLGVLAGLEGLHTARDEVLIGLRDEHRRRVGRELTHRDDRLDEHRLDRGDRRQLTLMGRRRGSRLHRCRCPGRARLHRSRLRRARGRRLLVAVHAPSGQQGDAGGAEHDQAGDTEQQFRVVGSIVDGGHIGLLVSCHVGRRRGGVDLGSGSTRSAIRRTARRGASDVPRAIAASPERRNTGKTPSKRYFLTTTGISNGPAWPSRRGPRDTPVATEPRRGGANLHPPRCQGVIA